MPQRIKYLIITSGTQPLPNQLRIDLTKSRYEGCGQVQNHIPGVQSKILPDTKNDIRRRRELKNFTGDEHPHGQTNAGAA